LGIEKREMLDVRRGRERAGARSGHVSRLTSHVVATSIKKHEEFYNMKVMVLVKASPETERGEMPSEQLLNDMMAYNEELVNAGIMLAGEGLHPSSKGVRVRFSGASRTVI